MLFDSRPKRKKRRNPRKRKPPIADKYNTYIETWFERDRANVDLRWTKNDETIVEWRDEAVEETVDDGYLDPRDWHGSALQYAYEMGIIRPG